MTSVAVMPAAVRDAIFVDELDIATGVSGPFRLKSAYRPIFSRAGGKLRPSGVQGITVVSRQGQPVTPEAILTECPPEARGFIVALGLALQLRNYGNIGIAGLDLHVDCDPSQSGAILPLLSGLPMAGWEDIVLGPEKLVCEVASAARADSDFWVWMEELRWRGVRLAGSFGADRTLPAEAKADVVRIESDWFRKTCEEPTVRLLGPIISVMRSHGSKVLVGGIETSQQLRVALEAGADLLEGDLLARPAPAGTVFDEAPLSITTLLGGHNVVSLRD